MMATSAFCYQGDGAFRVGWYQLAAVCCRYHVPWGAAGEGEGGGVHLVLAGCCVRVAVPWGNLLEVTLACTWGSVEGTQVGHMVRCHRDQTGVALDSGQGAACIPPHGAPLPHSACNCCPCLPALDPVPVFDPFHKPESVIG